MKLQHRVKFKKPRPKKPRVVDPVAAAAALDATAPPATGAARDATKATVTVSERELKFARALADTERHVRDASLVSLRSFLSSHATALSEAEWARLWKALFYCLWMADKRPVISAVVSDIVSLADVAGLPFLRALFVCLAREWFGIDRHRLNKFYELVDKALERAAADVINAADEDAPPDEAPPDEAPPDEEQKEQNGEKKQKKKKKKDNSPLQRALQNMLAMLDETVFAAADRGALGLALHVLDRHLNLLLIPLLRCATTLPGNKMHAVFDATMETPLLLLSSTKGYAPAVSRRVQEAVLEKLSDALSAEDLGLKLKERRDMVRRVKKRVWRAAAAEDSLPEVRTVLYDVHLSLKTYIAEADAEMAEDKVTKEKPANTDEAPAETQQS